MNEKKMAFAWAITLLLTGGWIVGLVVALNYNWAVGADTGAWLIRAQVASNPTDMQEYLIKCRDGMKNWGVTKGNAKLIWQTAESDMTLIMKALDRSIERCEDVKTFNKTSIEYQVALDDLRGQLRELNLYTPESWWIQHGLLLALWAWLGWIAVLYAWIICLEQ